MLKALLVVAALAAAVAVFLVLTYVRRSFLSRSGSVAMAARLSRHMEGRGWAPGFAVYESGTLRWYRMFSLAFGPRYSLLRHDVQVSERRKPVGPEAQIFPPEVAILRCKSATGEVELAMTTSAVTGFLSWLEAAPPGAEFYSGRD
ncbi:MULTISPECIES: DUF2550 domain-containing protein [Glycomyces]|jgi:hypothetical protein|uniref:DUF2550 family protein n=2 Tax=Glycomyces TaxID=58113 RepID=A0A9W6G4S8_9ACTN|nr:MULTISPECIES: DUF2550 domain-containing protein [Glycomyces]MDA1366891.1 DUF2550 domain-containing protein [Glycomyces algeriensis]MDN3240924.1 DUF2550 domain-containing protein [Glycomyces tritici]MDN3242873.1 DUF2550 domain-containing protein [Glycomyces tritici]MDR7352723.1 hypothetical protein [Glycomyces algeriensis]GLI40405.1 hypothetical protein GALLR39Z86_02550 [Glycomyces algeriensis]